MIGPNCVVKRNGAAKPPLVCGTVAAFAVLVSTLHLTAAHKLLIFIQIDGAFLPRSPAPPV
ncbi:MAG: hypothetical protein ACJ8AI_24235 [Rhodopila sp.]|jgi:hypothetical protein